MGRASVLSMSVVPPHDCLLFIMCPNLDSTSIEHKHGPQGTDAPRVENTVLTHKNTVRTARSAGSTPCRHSPVEQSRTKEQPMHTLTTHLFRRPRWSREGGGLRFLLRIFYAMLNPMHFSLHE